MKAIVDGQLQRETAKKNKNMEENRSEEPKTQDKPDDSQQNMYLELMFFFQSLKLGIEQEKSD